MQRRLIIALAILGLASSSAFAQAKASNDRNGFYYEAHFQAEVSGDKTFRGMSWHCKEKSCGTTNKVSASTGDDIASCKALVAWKGQLTAYSRSSKPFSAAQLTECNAPAEAHAKLPPNIVKPPGKAPKLNTTPTVRPPG